MHRDCTNGSHALRRIYNAKAEGHTIPMIRSDAKFSRFLNFYDEPNKAILLHDCSMCAAVDATSLLRNVTLSYHIILAITV